MEIVFCERCGCDVLECQAYEYFDSIYCRKCYGIELDNDIEICGGC